MLPVPRALRGQPPGHPAAPGHGENRHDESRCHEIKRTDKDFPLSWVRTFGKGRVYYSALGHNMHIYENPKVVAHYLAGIQWAIGDLAAPPPPGDP